MDKPYCVLCLKPILPGQKSFKLTSKGCEGIKAACEARGLGTTTITSGQNVHSDCRKTHCNPHYIASHNRKRSIIVNVSINKPTLRSTEVLFDYSKLCLFCGTSDIYDGRRSDFKLVPVRTYDCQSSLIAKCLNRNDDWAHRVKARIESVNDLHASHSVYHQCCNVNFRTGKQIPKRHTVGDSKRAKLGRPTDEVQTEAFLKVIEYLEHNDDEQITINTLIQKMAEYIDDIDIQPYGFTYMKAQIQKHFGNKVIITEVNGRPNVVTFWSTATAILQEFHSQSKVQNVEIEKNRIILTAAQLIKNDIKSLIQKRDAYPSCHDMASIDEACSFLPDSLQSFLKQLFTSTDGKMKIASLGQSIVQATRPRVIRAPLQLGLGIQLHHHFASKFLINTLHKHGFCCSYKEVATFERSAAVTQGTDLPNCTSEKCIQYVADNLHHRWQEHIPWHGNDCN